MTQVQRVSGYFSLGVEQGGLDFVDVDVNGDVPVYIDPTAIRVQAGDWVEACAHGLYTFFDELLGAIRADDLPKIRSLIYPLSEPNETHLGVSKGLARGRSLGSQKKADQLVAALRRSRAIKSGLIEDLEDTVLFVDGVGRDILSDITTCIIRAHLIEYTVNQCRFHGIPLENQISGLFWDSEQRVWRDDYFDLPRGPRGLLLLVPKAIVRLHPTYEKGQFYRGYLRPFFEGIELSKGVSSEFVRLVRAGKKNARLKVNMGQLDENLGTTKAKIAENAESFPQAMKKYRQMKAVEAQVPLSLEALATQTGTPEPSLRELYEEILAIQPGKAGATAYHRAVAAFLTALFTGSLGNQRLEVTLHGLKRIDITYDNVAGDGLFRWFGLHHAAASVPVECKNYFNDPANPELDQIAMRLSPARGEIGFLVCRTVSNKQRLLDRCRSAAVDNHGYVIALDDVDLLSLLEEFEAAEADASAPRRRYTVIRSRFDELQGITPER
ncbi:hypothetical protein KZC51_05975 [Microbacterium sp. SSW1-49]|uniref:Restriction endonuclease type IV Mrr domain-containing protein n=1 Tax=Microbacterium croceum TaxID=2851645 RepID=A0ABT0FC99_9MICO|nr:hypothetical protein [Microbacterium croceum]MCK2035679.1 hypothetical protein [Microbacterium croceum]